MKASLSHVALCFIASQCTAYMQLCHVVVFRSFQSCIHKQARTALALCVIEGSFDTAVMCKACRDSQHLNGRRTLSSVSATLIKRGEVDAACTHAHEIRAKGELFARAIVPEPCPEEPVDLAMLEVAVEHNESNSEPVHDERVAWLFASSTTGVHVEQPAIGSICVRLAQKRDDTVRQAMLQAPLSRMQEITTARDVALHLVCVVFGSTARRVVDARFADYARVRKYLAQSCHALHSVGCEQRRWSMFATQVGALFLPFRADMPLFAPLVFSVPCPVFSPSLFPSHLKA